MKHINKYFARNVNSKLVKTLDDEQWKDFNLAKDPKASEDDLLKLQQKYTGRTELDSQIQFFLAQNPATPTAAIDGMINNIIGGPDSNSNDRMDSYHRTSAYLGLAMENPRISVYLMEKLCTQKIVDFKPIQFCRHHLAKNPSLPYDLQKMIYEQETDPQILGALASNPSVDREFLGALIREQDWRILRDACKNPQILDEELKWLVRNPVVRPFVYENPKYDTSALDIYKEKSADLGAIAKNPNTTQKQLRDIETQISVFKDMSDIKIDAYIGIATHPDIDTAFLQKVIDIPDTDEHRDLKERTLVAAALNPTLTPDQQLMLLNAKTHHSYDLAVPLAYNPSVTEEIKGMIEDRGNPEALNALGWREIENPNEKEDGYVPIDDDLEPDM